MSEKQAEKRLFGTNGTRGVTGTEMTPDLVLKIGAAFGSMRRGRIAVGRDTRTSGETLLAALRAGLLSAGCDVTDCGILPTPALQYIVRGTFTGGAMITASHNPPEYNGVKILEPDGTEMGDTETLLLEQAILDRPPAAVPWDATGQVVSSPGLIDTYTDAIVAHFPDSPCRGMLVAVDPGSGPACRTTPEILRRIGCRVLTVNGAIDGTFPGRLPEPSEVGLAALADLVRVSGAAFGVAHDGDADRAVFVDENGQYIEENAEFALIARQACHGRKGLVVTPVSTSMVVEDVVRKEGSAVVYTKVGSIHVARTMLALIREGKTVLFGGEGNGGLIYPDHQFCRDGGMTAAMMASLCAREGRPLSALLSSLPQRFMIKGKIRAAGAREIVDRLSSEYSREETDQLDGLKIIRGGTWALVRASGTEPLIRIIAESTEKREAESFYHELQEAVTHLLEN